MDSRLKPFKSFEANGNYHVSVGTGRSHVTQPDTHRFTTYLTRQMDRACWSCRALSTQKSSRAKVMASESYPFGTIWDLSEADTADWSL